MSRPGIERLAEMRERYRDAPFDEDDLAPTWLEQFGRWLEEALQSGVPEPNAMVLATADTQARPSARTVLLKGVDERGFVFFTNLNSTKGRHLAENPRACLVFPWTGLSRQVVVTGDVEPVTAAESDAYFPTRPRGAQISAIASPQSQVVESRRQLERAHAEVAAGHPESGPLRRPSHWGGLRVVPDGVEFWQGRPDRLHDRLRFRRQDGQWIVERLAP